MAEDSSRFPPNSRLGNTDNGSYVGHMCYCPNHLDLSRPRESVADWVGSGKSLLPGHPVSLVTFEDGTSTIMCEGCGANAVLAAAGDREREKEEQIAGTVTREDMETAGIYDDYIATFREAASITTGYVDPNGELYPRTIDNPVLKVDKDSLTDEASVVSAWEEYKRRHPKDPSREATALGMTVQYGLMTSRHSG
ncbi:hypothetical protein L202_08427 [Cryptococcus amylolentus CBS 6039]|uniref:Uncharacterized protein n=2 Tax=Cryptococcus amylolentus TaxID=104669 RepID=A0A1E3H9J9_9TREE|nr:hypothetical protein L202_08427 [Cryptococcus amylolentus CBS 6039]ODN73032.1 hypothetical protein L202_08427 [Cryptococcus amylolentus CBS 6039]ODN98184.1 hypothetical protein I350_07830 [Cryptococcus amylolentus CBS 6273]